MEPLALFVGICSLVTYLSGVTSLDEKKRMLLDETESLSARMQDIQKELSFTQVQQGRKRKRNDALCDWMAECKKHLKEAQCLSGRVGRWTCFLVDDVKMRWHACKLIDAMRVHDAKGVVLRDQALFDAQGLCRGLHIPVKKLVGRVASQNLDQLKVLMEGDEVGRIAIYGIEGIGKTFLMKHLNNCVQDRFDYVFWVPSPVEFTIKFVQDAVAAAVKCDLGSDDDANVRAMKLRQKLSGLGSFALFLDGITGVHETDISLDRIGIPVPAKGSKCKLVLSSSSTLVCSMLNCSVTIKVMPLSRKEARQLFMREAKIGMGSVNHLDDLPNLLADTCYGVPRMIVKLATCMCGKDDPCEWRCAQYQLGCVGKKNKLPRGPKLGRESKRVKKDMILSSISLGS